MAPSISEAALTLESGPVEVDLSPVSAELIGHAEFFPMSDSVGITFGLVPATTDSVSWFTHKDGKRYGVVHTLFGKDPATTYKNKINGSSWTASMSGTAYKRQPIKEFLIEKFKEFFD